MDTMTRTKTLSVSDRCDRCGAQAFVHVLGVSGELLFCGHHFAKIMNDSKGKEKMESFAYEIIDERDFINKKNESSV